MSAALPVTAAWRLPRRLAYVVSHSQPWSSNGYAARSQAIARALQAAGHEVILFTRPGRPWDIEGFDPAREVALDHRSEGIRHIHLPLPPLPGADAAQLLAARARALAEAFAVFRPAAVLAASNWENAAPALQAARETGLPFFYEQRGFWEMTAQLSPEARQAAVARETEIARAAEAVFTLNRAMREELIRRGLAPERIFLLPNGVTLPVAAPLSRAEKAPGRGAGRGTGLSGRAALGCKSRYLLGYIGSLSDYEGVGDLLSLLALLRRGGPGAPALDVDLLIAGSSAPKGLILTASGGGGDGKSRAGSAGQDPALSALAARARRLGLGAHLHLQAQLPEAEVAGLYPLCDLILVPRHATPVTRLVPPIKPYSAAAQGVPVLMSDLPPLAEIAAEIGAGLFPPGDVNAMAGLVRARLARPEPPPPLAPALGWPARILALQNALARVAHRQARLNRGGDHPGALPG